MEVFDTHIHSEGRSIDDLAKMAEKGIKLAVSCAFYPIQLFYQETFIDLFRKLVTFEARRGEKVGMKIYAAVGVHPRCILPKLNKVLEFMESDGGWIAFGEIGLETASSKEVEVFELQLKLAKKLDMPCIIHTPGKNKKEVTLKTLELLKVLSFPEDLALIDHVNTETIDEVLKAGFYAGLTVQYGKLTERDVYEIVSSYGIDRLVLNSDTGFDEANMFAVVKAAEHLLNNMDEREVRKVVYNNGKSFFRI
jgi:hypothetical protein